MRISIVQLLLILMFVHFVQCTDSASTEKKINSLVFSDSEMNTQLQKAYKNIDPLKVDYYFNNQRAAHFKNKMDATDGGLGRLQHQANYAFELLNSGKTTAAITEYEKILSTLSHKKIVLDEASETKFKQLLGISYMRLAEQDNCVGSINPDACVIPFSVASQHTLKKGAKVAIGIYNEILKTNPTDYQTVWLLNIAHMAIGTYPEGIEPRFLLNAKRLESDIAFPKFENVAIKSGVNVNGLSGSCCTDDFNNDGLLDIVTSSWGIHDQLQYYINNGDGTFTDYTQQSGLTGITGGLNIIHADYNNDGFLDVLVLRGAWFQEQGNIPNSLLRNNGDGTFTDVTIESKLFSKHPTQTAAWADFNKDGWIDLLIANESSGRATNPLELFINNQDGTFTDRTSDLGLNDYRQFYKGVVIGDVSNDGWADIYLSNYSGRNTLLIHNGQPSLEKMRFIDFSMKAGVTAPEKSFPTWMWDFNNDGWEDIFVSAYGDPNSAQTPVGQVAQCYLTDCTKGSFPMIYQNNGNGTFTNVAPQLGLNDVNFTMGCNFGDLNVDGYLDMYLATGDPSFNTIVPNKVYVNNKGKQLLDVTTNGGFGNIQKGHGIGFADFDNDGDEDIYAVLGGAFEGDVFNNVLYENPNSENHKWITIQLEGKTANRAAIGSRIVVEIEDANGEIQKIYRTVGTGGSFGASSLRQEIGLGNATSIKSIQIIWASADAKIQTIKEQLVVDRFYYITEGAANIQILELPTFDF